MGGEYLDQFTEDELERLNGAISDALFPYGAENQDLWDSFTMPVGQPLVELREFPVDPIALACRAAPVDEWTRICAGLIDRWITSVGQREWLAAQSFTALAGQLRPWLSAERPKTFKGDVDGPEQPWATRLPAGCWLSVFVHVPDLGAGQPDLFEFVANKVVAGWGVSADDLLDATRRRLRAMPPPSWARGVARQEDDGPDQVDLWYLDAPEDTDPIPAAWQLVLTDVAPRPLVPGTLVAAPTRQTLLLSYPDSALTVEQRRAAIDRVGDHWRTAHPESRVQRPAILLDPSGAWQVLDEQPSSAEHG